MVAAVAVAAATDIKHHFAPSTPRSQPQDLASERNLGTKIVISLSKI
jgi:hypothetical protein